MPYRKITQKEARRMRDDLANIGRVMESWPLSTFANIGEYVTREIDTAIRCGFRVEVTANVHSNSITLTAIRRRRG